MGETVKFTVADNPVIFSGEVGSDKENLVKSARLFYVGKHKGRDYSKDDLKKIVDNFKGEEGVPVQLDHSTSARDTVGIVKSVALSKDGSEINGEVEFLGKENVDRVRLGLWKKVSVGLSIKQPEMELQEVSITPFPALKEAKVFSEDPPEDPKKAEEEKKAKKQDAEMANMTEIEKMKVEFAEMKAEKDALEEKINFKESQDTIERFVQAGKTTPKMKEKELEHFHGLPEEKKKSFLELKDLQPVLFDLKTYNSRNIEKPGEMSDADADKKAEQFISKK